MSEAARRPGLRSTLPRWDVVLFDDDAHTFEYVIEMLINRCGHSLASSIRLSRTLAREGYAVVFTTHRELAELKADQLERFGPDPRLQFPPRPMRTELRPSR